MFKKSKWTKAFLMFCLVFSLGLVFQMNAKAAYQSENNITMVLGESYSIVTDKEALSWTSSIPGAVSVDETGKVTAVVKQYSAVTVTAAYTDGTSENFSVKVVNPFFNTASKTIKQNDSWSVYFDKSFGTVTAEVADESIAEVTVNTNPYLSEWNISIKGIRDGQTTVTVYTDLGVYTCDITVTSTFAFTSNITSVERGEKIRLDMASGFQSYEWSVSDESIAELELYSATSQTSRYLVAKKAGTVEVSVKNELGQVATTTIEVTAEKFLIREDTYPSTSWNNSMNFSLCSNDSWADSTLVELPDVYSWSECTYQISNPSIISLEIIADYSWARVNALKPGDTKITVTNKWGETVTANIHVYEKIKNLAFTKDVYTVYLGQTVKLPYTYKSDTTNHNNKITYVYNTAYGTIKNGVFTPKKAGNLVVNIDAEDPDLITSDLCTVKIIKPAFAKSSYSVYKKKTVALKINGAGSTVKYSSSNTKVATVNSKGVVTGVKKGTATITATTNGQKMTTKVTVNNPKLSASSGSIYLKKTKTLKVTGGTGTVKWKSSNSKIAKVNSKGKITAVKPGKATITAKVSGETLKFKVTVKKPALSKTKKTLIAKEKYTLKINGGSGKIKWKSSNTKVAKVSSKGKITAVGKGTATISAKINGYTLKCKVTVKANQKKFSVNKNVYDYSYGEPEVRLSKVYYSGSSLKADIYVLNNRRFKAQKFDYIYFNIYDNKGKVIAKKKFKNVKLNVKPYSYKKITLTYTGSSIKQKSAILNDGVSYDWNYWYTYLIN